MAKRRKLEHPNRAHGHKRGHKIVACSIRGHSRTRRTSSRRRSRDSMGRFK
jgi:hypothetical protein